MDDIRCFCGAKVFYSNKERRWVHKAGDSRCSLSVLRVLCLLHRANWHTLVGGTTT